MQMLGSSAREGYTARYQTNYMDTTNVCIEFYYYLGSYVDQSMLSVIIISEEKMETVVQSTYGQTNFGWNRFYAVLPRGVNQVVIQGVRALAGPSSLAIDDVYIQQCGNFGEYVQINAYNAYPWRFSGAYIVNGGRSVIGWQAHAAA